MSDPLTDTPPAAEAAATAEPEGGGKGKRKGKGGGKPALANGEVNLSELAKIQTVAGKFGGVAELKKKCEQILKMQEK